MNKSFCEQSIDTQMCVEKMVEMQMGDTIAYDVFSELIGRSVRKEARHILESARRFAEREHLIFTDCLSGEGIKRITEPEVLKGRTDRVKQTTRRRYQKLVKTLNRIGNEKLSREEVTKKNSEVAMAGTVIFFMKPKAIETVQAQIGDRATVSAGTVFDMFQDRKVG